MLSGKIVIELSNCVAIPLNVEASSIINGYPNINPIVFSFEEVFCRNIMILASLDIKIYVYDVKFQIYKNHILHIYPNIELQKDIMTY